MASETRRSSRKGLPLRSSVRAVAQDTPDRYPDVDEQLLADYPELRLVIQQANERIRQQKEGGR